VKAKAFTAQWNRSANTITVVDQDAGLPEWLP
jgi:hypothetical protein